MKTKEDLQNQIAELEEQLKPLRKELSAIYALESEETEAKINRTELKQDKFEPMDLVFAAYSRCECGAGFAYPKNIGINGSWRCSAILMGVAEAGTMHSSPLPFSFYEVKSENQPSAHGATTRPGR